MNARCVGPLREPDHATVCALLSDAFAQDPAYDYFLAGYPEAKHDALRLHLIDFIVSYHRRSGMPLWGVTEHGKLLACALLEVPVPVWRRILAVLALLPQLIRTVPWHCFKRMNRYALLSRNDMPRDIRHYLVKIGVRPNHQGEGLGKSLIRKIIEDTRKQGQPLGLDTENPANVPLYQHLGFTLQGQQQLGNLTIYQMLYR